MERADRVFEGGGELADRGEIGETWQTLERHHVEERCLVVESVKSRHMDIISF